MSITPKHVSNKFKITLKPHCIWSLNHHQLGGGLYCQQNFNSGEMGLVTLRMKFGNTG